MSRGEADVVKQYKSYVRCQFTVRAAFRIIEKFLPEEAQEQFLTESKYFLDFLMNDMKLQNPKAGKAINLALVKDHDQERFFELASKHLPVVVRGVKEHPRYQPTAETLKLEQEMYSLLDQKSGRISLGKLLLYAATALKSGGKSRLLQIVNILNTLTCNSDADPSLLREVEEEADARENNGKKYSTATDIQAHVKTKRARYDI